MSIARLALPLLLACFAGGVAAQQGNAEAAKGKISMCQGCHGIPGYKATFPQVYHVPRLGGQHPAYIVKALKGYQSGTRIHPTMQSIAATLTEQDMADLAAHYGAKK